MTDSLKEERRAAYMEQQSRAEAHYSQRPRHPNEDILKALGKADTLHDEAYWATRANLFRPVYQAIENWSTQFWKNETRIEDPDSGDAQLQSAYEKIAELEQELSFLANTPEKVTIVLAGQWDAMQARIRVLEVENEALRHDIERYVQIASELASKN